MPQPNAYFWGVQSLSRETKLIVGSFAPAGAGALTDAKGDGWTAARSGVGTYLVTFTHNWKDMLGAIATLQLASAADSKLQVGTYDATARTLVIRNITTASAAEIAADANNRVNFAVLFKRTSTTPQNTASVS